VRRSPAHHTVVSTALRSAPRYTHVSNNGQPAVPAMGGGGIWARRGHKRTSTPPNDDQHLKIGRAGSISLQTSASSGDRIKVPTPHEVSEGSVSDESCVAILSSSSDNTDSSEAHGRQPRLRIPPIIVQPGDWRTIAPEIMPKFSSNLLTAKFTNNTFHLQATNIEIFRTIQRFMTDE